MKNKKTKCIAIFIGIIFCCNSCIAQKATQKSKPNVIVIVADDMNMWSMLKNYAPLKTPYLDKLKSESLYYANATCSAPVCIPSRASFFTGMSPHNTGAYVNFGGTWKENMLSTTEVLPELFKNNGYLTWGGGKIFHAPINGDRQKAMFDNEVFEGGFGPFSSEEHWYTESRFFSVEPWTGPDTDFPDVVNANAAIKFLNEKHDKPFFLYYGMYRPHTPYTAPKRFFDQYNDTDITLAPGYLANDLDDVPMQGRQLVDSLKQYHKENLSKEEVILDLMKGYCANYSFADWNIGRVIEALDKSEFVENTIVIFYSDNGFHNGTKEHWVKSTLWEEADNIPLLIRLPSKYKGEREQTVSLLDIYPTLIDYCGLQKPSHQLDGKSMTPTFKDMNYKWNRPSLTFYGADYSSVRNNRYRYIRYPDGSEELYDHSTDQYEHHNLANEPQYNSIKKELSNDIPKKFAKSLGGSRERTAKDVNDKP